MIDIPKFNFNRDEWVDGHSLNGRKLSQLICDYIRDQLVGFDKKPGLAALIVGNDSASEIYVKNKEKRARAMGFYSEIKKLPEHISQEKVIQIIEKWNTDNLIHGILVQLPLPNSMKSQEVLSKISVQKDADGFHFENMGRLFANEKGNIPCTPLGIMVMLNELKEPLEGKHAIILGRSNIVGKPIAQILLNYANCTTTVCHSKTKNIAKYIHDADILISAMGQRGVVQAEKIKQGCIVIDVGIHRTNQGICGDINHELLTKNNHLITPVPGGVGPMTIAMLMYNTYQNFIQHTT